MQNKRLRRRVAALERQVQGLLEIVQEMHPAKVRELAELRTKILIDDTDHQKETDNAEA